MEFLHDGRPPVVREAVYEPPAVQPLSRPPPTSRRRLHATTLLRDPRLAQRGQQGMGHPPVRSRGARRQRRQAAGRRAERRAERCGRGAAGARRRGAGWSIACGMNPRYGDFDTYHMAASAIDEAVRNCVAVGADPARIAILDNFCWGNTDRPETLGSLVRAALGLPRRGRRAGHAVHQRQGQPEQRIQLRRRRRARRRPIAHSAVAADQRAGPGRRRRPLRDDGPRSSRATCSTRSGLTQDELGGSHFALVEGLDGRPGAHGRCGRGQADVRRAARGDLAPGCVRACHDLSEGGLAVAAAEMAFAGGLGLQIESGRRAARLPAMPHDDRRVPAVLRIEHAVPVRSAARARRGVRSGAGRRAACGQHRRR